MIDRYAILDEAAEETDDPEKIMNLTLDLTLAAVIDSMRKAAGEWEKIKHHTAAMALRQFALELEND